MAIELAHDQIDGVRRHHVVSLVDSADLRRGRQPVKIVDRPLPRPIASHRTKMLEGCVVADDDRIGPARLDPSRDRATILGQADPQQLRSRRATRVKHRKRRLPRPPGPLVDPGLNDGHRSAVTRGGELLERHAHRKVVMVPRVVEFRVELPKTPVGKVLRRELRDKTPA